MSTKALITGTAVLTLGGGFTAVLGYVYQIMMARHLDPVAYGELSALMALAVIVPVPLVGMMSAMVRAIAMQSANEVMVERILRGLRTLALVITMAMLLLAIVFAGPIAKLFSVADGGHVTLIAIYIVFANVLSLPYLAFHQGKLHMWRYTIANIVGVSIRIVFTFFMLAWVTTIEVALIGQVVGAMALYLAISLGTKTLYANASDLSDLQYVPRSFVVTTIVSVSMLTIATQIDVIWARIFLSGEEAGIYAALAMIGKSTMYLTGSIATAIVPITARTVAEGRSAFRDLAVAIFIAMICSTIAIIVFDLWPQRTMSLMAGISYVEGAAHLSKYAVLMTVLTLIVIGEQWALAQERSFFFFPLAIGTVATGVYSMSHVQVLADILNIQLVISVSVMLFGYFRIIGFYFGKQHE